MASHAINPALCKITDRKITVVLSVPTYSGSVRVSLKGTRQRAIEQNALKKKS